MSVVWLAQTVDDGVGFRVGREGERLLAEWPGIGTLSVDRAGTNPHFSVGSMADPAIAAKLRTSTIPALLNHLRGALVLHASAVAIGAQAAAFIGDSGAGKSTLAFALSTFVPGVSALLSDDCLSIVNGLVQPADAVSWIDSPAKAAMGVCNDHTRSASPALRVGRTPVPLRWIVHLVFADTTRVRRLRGSAVAAVLSRAMIRFVVDEPEVLRADLEMVGQLAATTEVIEFSRPKGWEQLPSSTAMLRDVLC
jgi:hypothetical protein